MWLCWLCVGWPGRSCWRFAFPCGNSYFRSLPCGTHRSPQSYIRVHLGTLPKDRLPVALTIHPIYNVISVCWACFQFWPEGCIHFLPQTKEARNLNPTSSHNSRWAPLLLTIPVEPPFFSQFTVNLTFFPQFPVNPTCMVSLSIVHALLHFSLTGLISFVTHFQPPCVVLFCFPFRVSCGSSLPCICQIMVRTHQ